MNPDDLPEFATTNTGSLQDGLTQVTELSLFYKSSNFLFWKLFSKLKKKFFLHMHWTLKKKNAAQARV